MAESTLMPDADVFVCSVKQQDWSRKSMCVHSFHIQDGAQCLT